MSWLEEFCRTAAEQVGYMGAWLGIDSLIGAGDAWLPTPWLRKCASSLTWSSFLAEAELEPRCSPTPTVCPRHKIGRNLTLRRVRAAVVFRT